MNRHYLQSSVVDPGAIETKTPPPPLTAAVLQLQIIHCAPPGQSLFPKLCVTSHQNSPLRMRDGVCVCVISRDSRKKKPTLSARFNILIPLAYSRKATVFYGQSPTVIFFCGGFNLPPIKNIAGVQKIKSVATCCYYENLPEIYIKLFVV